LPGRPPARASPRGSRASAEVPGGRTSMKWNRRTNTIILWAISIGLLVGMVLTFTPSLGLFGGPSANAQGTPQLTVNGETIYEADVLRMRQNSLFTVVTEGQVRSEEHTSELQSRENFVCRL